MKEEYDFSKAEQAEKGIIFDGVNSKLGKERLEYERFIQ